ncbi:MAG: hypothetical protein LBM65_07005 [Oscillospiraceae bacterium]|jgi:hypothetical protein|nr:hypothetical protein [Oscillospiraceae bacterium]
MDVFIEQLVKKKQTAADFAKKAAIVLGCIALPIAVMACVYINFYLFYIGLFLIPFSAYFGWYMFGFVNLEFEYIVTNSTLTIDKILGQRRRKRLIKIDIHDIKALELNANDGKLENERYAKVVEAAKTQKGTDRCAAAVFNNTFGNTLIVFSPDERTLEAMKPFLSPTVRRGL